ncbi:MAG TPA: hypothetical protein VFZ61_32365 [Polyangiales bacterium]
MKRWRVWFWWVAVLAVGCEVQPAERDEQESDAAAVIGTSQDADTSDPNPTPREEPDMITSDAAANPGAPVGSADAATPSATAGKPDATAGAAPRDGGPQVSKDIVGVGFDQSRGGYPIPVLLFGGGYASFDVDQLVKPIDIEYDIVEHPESWYEWRRSSTGLELKAARGEWEPVFYKYECSALARGTVLSGVFEDSTVAAPTSGAGLIQITRYGFGSNGSIQSCTMKKFIIGANISVEREQRQGTYTLDGYVMQATYTDGTRERVPFFYDPARPTRLWLERTQYVVPTKEPTTLCVTP